MYCVEEGTNIFVISKKLFSISQKCDENNNFRFSRKSSLYTIFSQKYAVVLSLADWGPSLIDKLMFSKPLLQTTMYSYTIYTVHCILLLKTIRCGREKKGRSGSTEQRKSRRHVVSLSFGTLQ